MDKSNQKKRWYKRWWVWVIIVFILIGIGGAGANNSPKSKSNTETTNSTTTQQSKPEEKPAEKWDLETVYGKIQNGMTKAQVEEVTGKKSDNCTESQTEYLGKSESCSYGNAFIDKGSIMVIYSQDKVSSKTKSSY
jgi:hypothetical protein